MNAIKLRIARKSDLVFVSHLQKKFSNQLGFLPTAALIEYLDASRVLLALENDLPAAYLLYRPSTRRDPATVTIIQAAVALDAQRRHVGLSLVQRLTGTAILSVKASLNCKCATDIEANSFWIAAGFKPTTTIPSMGARGRSITHYQKALFR